MACPIKHANDCGDVETTTISFIKPNTQNKSCAYSAWKAKGFVEMVFLSIAVMFSVHANETTISWTENTIFEMGKTGKAIIYRTQMTKRTINERMLYCIA